MVMFKRRVAGRITISQRVYPADIFDLITFVVWSTSIKKESRDMHLSNTCSTEGRKICRGAPHSFLSALLRLPVLYTVPLRVSRLHCSQLVCIRVHCTRFEWEGHHKMFLCIIKNVNRQLIPSIRFQTKMGMFATTAWIIISQSTIEHALGRRYLKD